MIPFALTAEAFAALRRHALRSSLTALGMVFGVGAVVAMLAISEGARLQALSAINDLGLSNIIIRSHKPSAAAVANKAKGDGREVLRYGLTEVDRQRLMSEMPNLELAISSRPISRKVLVGDHRVEARVLATEPAYADIARLQVARGRFLADLDQERRQPVVVLGARVAHELFPLADPLDGRLSIGGVWWHVVGILSPGHGGGIAGSATAEELDRSILLPSEAVRSRWGLIDIQAESSGWQITRVEVGELVLRFAPGTDMAARGELARRIIARDGPRQDAEVVVPLELLESRRKTQGVFTVVMASIASIALLVGGIGIMNIMLASVLERTREIGIRRAVGARRRDILAQFLAETVALCLLGGLAGLSMGCGGAWLVGHLAGWPVSVTAWSVGLSLGICVAVGLVFGLQPAVQASRMQPVDALRQN